MTRHPQDRAAGEFAQQRFDARRRAWISRRWWALPIVGMLVALAPVTISPPRNRR